MRTEDKYEGVRRRREIELEGLANFWHEAWWQQEDTRRQGRDLDRKFIHGTFPLTIEVTVEVPWFGILTRPAKVVLYDAALHATNRAGLAIMQKLTADQPELVADAQDYQRCQIALEAMTREWHAPQHYWEKTPFHDREEAERCLDRIAELELRYLGEVDEKWARLRYGIENAIDDPN